MRLALYLMLLTVLSSFSACRKVPHITLCAVDGKEQNFDCVTQDQDGNKTNSTIEFKDGLYLECISPEELEIGLKACKAHKRFEVTICQLRPTLNSFTCTDPKGVQYDLDFKLIDHYACFSEADRQRILERCKFSLENM